MALVISIFNTDFQNDIKLKAGDIMGNEALNRFMDTRNQLCIHSSGIELSICCDILGRRNPSGKTHAFIGDNAKEITANWNAYQKEVYHNK